MYRRGDSRLLTLGRAALGLVGMLGLLVAAGCETTSPETPEPAAAQGAVDQGVTVDRGESADALAGT